MSYLLKEMLRDKLYALSKENFDKDIKEILECLNFSVKNIYYKGKVKEFIYGYLDKSISLTNSERKYLETVELISYTKLSIGIPVCFVLLDEQGGIYRNDLTCKITKFFMKVLQKKLICCFFTDNRIQFTGIQYNVKEKKSEVLLSEWFSFENFDIKGDAIIEIDASTYDCKSRCQFYVDYIYSICRVYDKYPESKMYLIYGCDSYVYLSGMDNYLDDYDKIDREGTLNINKQYYLNIYEEDYYPLNISEEDDDFDFVEELDDEFEWTMLELELESEENSDEEYDYFENDYEEESLMTKETMPKLNPVEMLEYIRRYK